MRGENNLKNRFIWLAVGTLLTIAVSVSVPPAFAGDEEKAVIAKCAVLSGSTPAGFAGCAFSGLALSQLRKCIGPKGCYGPNNDLVKFSAWMNKTLWGNCGFQASGSKKSITILNTSNVPVTYDIESETTDWSTSTLQPGHAETWDFPSCDTWANVDASGDSIGWDMGSVIEFGSGKDGFVHQYSMTAP